MEIGGIPILLQPSDPEFCELLEKRYAAFVNPVCQPAYRFEIQLDPAGEPSDEDAQVSRDGSLWRFQRGDFRATWDARTGRGWIRQRIPAIRSLIVLIALRATGVSENRRRLMGVGFGKASARGP